MVNMSTNAITINDLGAMTDHPDWGGWGYLGHESRTAATDAELVAAANDANVDATDLFLWANSRCARHFMDMYPDPRFGGFGDELARSLPVLRAEVA